MFKELKNFIKKTVGYDPNQKTGQFVGTGSNIENDGLKPEPNGYENSQNILNVHPDGGENTDLNVRTTMKDVQDWHTEATQEILGQPQTARPDNKNRFQNVDAQLAAQYYGNMK